jgi:hypothetical protein
MTSKDIFEKILEKVKDDFENDNKLINDSTDSLGDILNSTSSYDSVVNWIPYYRIYNYPYEYVPPINTSYFDISKQIKSINDLINIYNKLQILFSNFLGSLNSPFINKIVYKPHILKEIPDVKNIPIDKFGLDFANSLIYVGTTLTEKIKILLSFKNKISNMDQQTVNNLYTELSKKID